MKYYDVVLYYTLKADEDNYISCIMAKEYTGTHIPEVFPIASPTHDIIKTDFLWKYQRVFAALLALPLTDNTYKDMSMQSVQRKHCY
jgi:hypothetical protein